MYPVDQIHSASHRVQIKICGITSVEDALACATMGTDALGLVFYPKSPRYVSLDRAAMISSVLPAAIVRVGVFVNESYETIMATVSACKLSAVQLHGQEPPKLIEKLANHDVDVIKCLYLKGCPAIDTAGSYNACSFLLECSAGKLPGGNAMTWDWSGAREFAEKYPTIIAGGLNPENVAEAIRAAAPDAVDVSSGVEALPGRKDKKIMHDFINAVHLNSIEKPTRRIF